MKKSEFIPANTKIIFFVIIITLLGCGRSQRQVRDLQEDTKPIETFRLSKRPAERNILLPGELQPYYSTRIYAKVEGYVDEIKVDRGSRVRKGEVLAVLNAPELRADLARAEAASRKNLAALTASRFQYIRLKEASITLGAVAPYDLELSLSKYMGDSAAYLAALSEEKVLSETAGFLIIRAPFSGMITERLANPGDLTGKGNTGQNPMFVLEDLNRLRLIVAVPEMEIGNIGTADTVSFMLDAFPGKIFKAVYARRSGSLDQETRSESLEFEVQNDELIFAGNMYAQVELHVRRSVDTFLIPQSAIVRNTERQFVIRVREGKAEWIDVTKGYQVEDEVEIFGPLNDGDILLKNGDEEISPGMKIAI